MAGASKCLLDVMDDFIKKWEELYLLTITQQSKWFSSNHELGKNDIVFIKDLKTERGTSKLLQFRGTAGLHSSQKALVFF